MKEESCSITSWARVVTRSNVPSLRQSGGRAEVSATAARRDMCRTWINWYSTIGIVRFLPSRGLEAERGRLLVF